MKTEIRLTVPPDCFILCQLFGIRLEDLLLHYMKHVDLDRLPEIFRGQAHEAVESAMRCFFSHKIDGK